MADENKSVVLSGGDDVAPMEEDVLAITDQSIKLWKQMTVRALKLTTEQDWVNQDGRPYLQHSGAERIAKPYGVSVTNTTKEKIVSSDDGGQYYIWVYEGDASMMIGKRLITQHAVGNCSSRDTLYGRKGGDFKPLSQIDEPSVMKAAHTNMIVNAITHILGLRNLTWDQLKEAGINIDKIGKIEHQTGSRGGNTDRNLSAESKDRLTEVIKMGMEMNDGDEQEASRYFDAISTFNYKDKNTGDAKSYHEPNPRRWSEKVLNIAYGKIKKDYDGFMKAVGGEE